MLVPAGDELHDWQMPAKAEEARPGERFDASAASGEECAEAFVFSGSFGSPDGAPAESAHAEAAMTPEALSATTEGGRAVYDRCPFLKRAVADWIWPVEGICRARQDGHLMVPPVPHYLHLCITPDHRLCEVFRARACPTDKVPA